MSMDSRVAQFFEASEDSVNLLNVLATTGGSGSHVISQEIGSSVEFEGFRTGPSRVHPAWEVRINETKE